MSWLHRLRSLRIPDLQPPIEVAVPFWETRPLRGRPPAHLRVLWMGTHAAPVPILVPDPPEFDPQQ